MSKTRIRALTRLSAFSPCFQKNTPLLTPVWRRGRKTACHGSQTPFLDIGLYEDETTLAKVDVDRTRTIGSDGGEEVLRFETMDNVIELLAVAREEYGAGSGPIAYAHNVALNIFGTVKRRGKGLIIASVTARGVGYGRFVPS